jgi:hypothetical protein
MTETASLKTFQAYMLEAWRLWPTLSRQEPCTGAPYFYLVEEDWNDLGPNAIVGPFPTEEAAMRFNAVVEDHQEEIPTCPRFRLHRTDAPVDMGSVDPWRDVLGLRKAEDVLADDGLEVVMMAQEAWLEGRGRSEFNLEPCMVLVRRKSDGAVGAATGTDSYALIGQAYDDLTERPERVSDDEWQDMVRSCEARIGGQAVALPC